MNQQKNQQNRRKSYDPDSTWDGFDRRTCLNHRAHEIIMEGQEKRISNIEHNQPVPYTNFKWVIGILISMMISLFSITYYTSKNATDALHLIQIQQERLIVNAESIRDDIKQLQRDMESWHGQQAGRNKNP